MSVTYHIESVPSPGPGFEHLPKIIADEATRKERDEFEGAWHERVDAVLTDDDLFSVVQADSFHG